MTPRMLMLRKLVLELHGRIALVLVDNLIRVEGLALTENQLAHMSCCSIRCVRSHCAAMAQNCIVKSASNDMWLFDCKSACDVTNIVCERIVKKIDVDSDTEYKCAKCEETVSLDYIMRSNCGASECCQSEIVEIRSDDADVLTFLRDASRVLQ